MNIYLKNTGSSTIPVPYTFQMYNQQYIPTTPNNVWNFQLLSNTGGTITGSVTASWAALVAPNGAEVNIGMPLTLSSTVSRVSPGSSAFKPTSFKIGSLACTIL
jgi:hypothetical protein